MGKRVQKSCSDLATPAKWCRGQDSNLEVLRPKRNALPCDETLAIITHLYRCINWRATEGKVGEWCPYGQPWHAAKIVRGELNP